MNKQQFYQWIDNPHLLNEETLKQLNEVVQEYPFFQAARMLLIKNLHNLEHIRFNVELKTAAAHIANRRQLYELVHKIRKTEEHLHIPESVTPAESKKPVVPTAQPKPLQTTEIKSTTNNEVKDYFDVSDDLTAFVAPATGVMEAAEEQILLPSADLLEYDMDIKQSHYSIETELPPIDLSDDNNYSFSDWLNQMRHLRQSSRQEAAASPKQTKTANLIDNFLSQNNVRITPKAVETQEQIAQKVKQSETEIDDLPSETLAKIYIQQKHFGKAINIFEKLRLKYPEKSTYFATRISELEILLKTQ